MLRHFSDRRGVVIAVASLVLLASAVAYAQKPTDATKKTKPAEKDFRLVALTDLVYLPKPLPDKGGKRKADNIVREKEGEHLFRVLLDGKGTKDGFFNLDGKPVGPTWKSSDPSVLKITLNSASEPVFTIHGPGKATVTVSVGEWSAHADLEVLNSPFALDMSRHDLIKQFGYPARKYKHWLNKDTKITPGFDMIPQGGCAVYKWFRDGRTLGFAVMEGPSENYGNGGEYQSHNAEFWEYQQWPRCLVCIPFGQVKGVVTSPTKAKEDEAAKEEAGKNVKDALAKGVKTFLTTDYGDTDVKITDNRKKAFDQLAKKHDGQKITLSFPIENISPIEQGVYRLLLQAPDFPESPRRYDLYIMVDLTKEQALKIDSSSVLRLSGPVKLLPQASHATLQLQSFYALQRFADNKSITVLGWVYRFKGAVGWEDRRIAIAVDKPTLSILTNGKEVVSFPGKKEEKEELEIEAEIAKAVEAFLKKDFGDTAVKRKENREEEFEKLAKLYSSRRIQVRFPIKNVVSVSSPRNSRTGSYGLTLEDTKEFSSESASFLQRLEVRLTEKQSLRISDSSILQISGNVNLTRYGHGRINGDQFTAGVNSDIIIAAWGGQTIYLAIERPTVRIITLDKDGDIETAITPKPLPYRKR